MSRDRLGYIPALDGVRGIAIAAVVGTHFFGLSGGLFGVDLFFVLSGFLITSILLEEHRATGKLSLRRFYARRARRLMPAVGVVLLVIAMLVSWTGAAQVLRLLGEGGLYLSNFFRAYGRPGILAHSPLGHFWSLAEEEQFYALWPLLLLLLLRRRVRESTLLSGLAAAALMLAAYRIALVLGHSSWTRVYYAPDSHADGIVLGCALAFARQRIRVGQLVSIGALAGFVAAATLGHQTLDWSAYGLPLVELASAAIVLAATEDGLLSRFLSFEPLVSLGVISYSLYLWHVPVFWMLGHRYPLLALALSLVAATLSYRLVEQPFRHVLTGAGSRRLPPATAARL